MKVKLSSSIAVVLQDSQTAVVFYHFQVQLLAVIQGFSGFNCFLPIFKFYCNCTSGILRLQLIFTFFSNSTVYFFGVLFDYQHLFT
jgi:hypothetical protein